MVPSASKVIPLKRRRTRKACTACRQRKRKCDGELPCSMCVAYGYPCTYDGVEDKQALFAREPVPTRQSVMSSVRQLENSKSSVVSPQNVLIPEAHTPDNGILDPSKSRYMSRSSAIAFPRSLGLELQSGNPPHLHSFAWNCGVRSEESSSSHRAFHNFFTQEECVPFIDQYFSIVHPIFDVVNMQHFKKRVAKDWDHNMDAPEFQALLCGVVALGSFFSGSSGHPRELEMVRYAKEVLEDPAVSRFPTIEHVSAWFLRTIYLRATTRPHVAWLASCMTVHLAEAIGLHHEIEKVELTITSKTHSTQNSINGRERARRLFWCAWSTNAIISYEYGRSSVTLNRISCQPIDKNSESCTAQYCELAQIIPRDHNSSEYISDLLEALSRVFTASDDNPFLSLVKADLCHAFYRRLRLACHTLAREVIIQIIDVGNKAINAAYELAQKQQTWWNVLSTTFQYICVLLAIDSPDSILNVPIAKRVFDSIVHILNTHLAIEAQKTLNLLLQDSMQKKKKELNQLGSATQEGNVSEDDPPHDVDWDILLDPLHASTFMLEDLANF